MSDEEQGRRPTRETPIHVPDQALRSDHIGRAEVERGLDEVHARVDGLQRLTENVAREAAFARAESIKASEMAGQAKRSADAAQENSRVMERAMTRTIDAFVAGVNAKIDSTSAHLTRQDERQEVMVAQVDAIDARVAVVESETKVQTPILRAIHDEFRARAVVEAEREKVRIATDERRAQREKRMMFWLPFSATLFIAFCGACAWVFEHIVR